MIHSHLHHHNFERLFHLKDKLGYLYFHIMIQEFAKAMIYIFVPIYLLQVGFELWQVFFYLLVEWATFGLLTPIYGTIIHKVGVREVILLRTPLFIVGLFLIYLLKESIFLQNYYFLIAILLGSSGALYTLSITSLFVTYMGNKNQSVKTAKLMTYPKLITIFSPAIGGFILYNLGFTILLSIVSVLLFLSIIPIYFINKSVDHPKFKLHIFKEIKIEFKEFFFLNVYGVKGFITFLILPLALYIYSKNAATLGFFVSIISLASALFTFYIGKISKKLGVTKMIKFGSLISGLFFLVLGFYFDSSLFIYLALLSGIITMLVDLPYETHLYVISREHHAPLEYMVFKEFSLFFGRLLLFGFLIVIFTRIEIAFYIGSLASFIFMFFG